jgi:YgiT-type zinc finger domain-containing protein
MQPGVTSVTFDRDNVIIVFRNVPAQVCDVCGDYVVDGDIGKYLLKIAKEERAKGHQISVLDYKKAA